MALLHLCAVFYVINVSIFRFDVSYPAFNFCKLFFHPDHNLVCVTEALAEADDNSTMDCLSTTHFGLLCLYIGGKLITMVTTL